MPHTTGLLVTNISPGEMLQFGQGFISPGETEFMSLRTFQLGQVEVGATVAALVAAVASGKAVVRIGDPADSPPSLPFLTLSDLHNLYEGSVIAPAEIGALSLRLEGNTVLITPGNVIVFLPPLSTVGEGRIILIRNQNIIPIPLNPSATDQINLGGVGVPIILPALDGITLMPVTTGPHASWYTA